LRIYTLVLAAALMLSICTGCAKQTATKEATVSAQQYEQLTEGIAYDDVIKLVGGPGKLISESGTKDSADYITTVQYNGEQPKSTVKLGFRQGKLVTKSMNTTS
jgi:outer membrane protein assembly factor BamE (lipoprotein component of BamABCDE complex)